MLCASAATLTKRSIVISGDELRKLADIDLPFLHDLTLSITRRRTRERDFQYGCSRLHHYAKDGQEVVCKW